MIYSKMRSDTDIFKEINSKTKVFFLGCPICANTSLYIDKGSDGSAMIFGLKPVSMSKELKRLKGVANNDKIKSDSWVGSYGLIALCALNESNRKKIIKKTKNFDVVVTLCCDAGKDSIQEILPEKKVIKGMNSKGIAMGILKNEFGLLKQFIDKETVKIKPFSFTG
jgi:hypothetical protein